MRARWVLRRMVGTLGVCHPPPAQDRNGPAVARGSSKNTGPWKKTRAVAVLAAVLTAATGKPADTESGSRGHRPGELEPVLFPFIPSVR